jgi:hypothetical protein
MASPNIDPDERIILLLGSAGDGLQSTEAPSREHQLDYDLNVDLMSECLWHMNARINAGAFDSKVPRLDMIRKIQRSY